MGLFYSALHARIGLNIKHAGFSQSARVFRKATLPLWGGMHGSLIGIYRNLQRFRGGFVFKAHKPVNHSTLDWRVTKKKRRHWYQKISLDESVIAYISQAARVFVLGCIQGYLAHKKATPP